MEKIFSAAYLLLGNISVIASIILLIFVLMSFLRCLVQYRKSYAEMSNISFVKTWYSYLFEKRHSSILSVVSVAVCICIFFTSSFFQSIAKIQNIHYLNPGTYSFYVSIKKLDNGKMLPAEIKKRIDPANITEYIYELCNVEYPERNIIHFGTEDIVLEKFPDYFTTKDSEGRIESHRYNETLVVNEDCIVYCRGEKMSCKLLNKHANSDVLQDDSDFSLVNLLILVCLELPAIVLLLLKNKCKQRRNAAVSDTEHSVLDKIAKPSGRKRNFVLLWFIPLLAVSLFVVWLTVWDSTLAILGVLWIPVMYFGLRAIWTFFHARNIQVCAQKRDMTPVEYVESYIGKKISPYLLERLQDNRGKTDEISTILNEYLKTKEITKDIAIVLYDEYKEPSEEQTENSNKNKEDDETET